MESGSGDDTVWNITLLANRQNSSPVAFDFIQDTGGFPPPNHQWSPVAAVVPGYPKELNFFFGVNICTSNANVGCFTLDLGQGNTGFLTFHNNWWIGNSNLIVALDNDFADLVFSNGVDVHFTPNGNGVDSFNLAAFAGTPIPESATWTLMGLGALGLIGLRRQAARASTRCSRVTALREKRWRPSEGRSTV
jgi:hypothetical protein